ncbi:DUF6463 family protein [Amycolatopsis taiwanensis]|uniref:Uncharacterized protein n=1 Tax=Amycolatopsis taiwanensis TaxID=342230 RepID=A0A9W6R2Z2_9PSEU|nr:DUF6463 family protein [Amycolatopsis taiwanensis]GLY66627.1 hypothetical protein Atai01_32460 [Amycolatopsis taiwanensis]
MNGLNRWIPRLINITAVLHFVWGFALSNVWDAITHDGFFPPAVDTDTPAYWHREAGVWFLVSGALLLVLGTMTRSVVRLTGRVPAQVGWFLMATGVPLCLLTFPVTGAWALIAISILALTATYRARTSGQAETTKTLARAAKTTSA